MKNLTRRDFLRAGSALAAGLCAPRLGFGQNAPQTPQLGKAKAVIQIWLWGGPCHMDTFDPKPKAGNDYAGPFSTAIATKTDGLTFNPRLSQLAAMSDKLSIIRSMTHSTNAHETASYLVQTGRMPGGTVYPCVGAVISKFKGYEAGYKNVIPPYIVLTEPLGRFSESGFLGARYKPFATGGDPAKNPFVVEGIVAEGVSVEHQKGKRELLEELNTFKKAMNQNPALAKGAISEDQAYDLIMGDAGKIFDLSDEPEKVRERYGKNTLGQSCIIARRLVEAGVPYVTVNSKGWDTHKMHFKIMENALPMLDRAVSALIEDLSQRGLLDTTIVWCGGEFGRAPKIQWTPPFSGGRGHWGYAFSTLMAGGGFKGGTFVGETDDKAEYVTKRPVHPSDLIGTIYNRLGIDSNTTIMHPNGYPVSVIEPKPKDAASDGLLFEVI